MSFAWPHLLWIALAPAALLGWELTHRRRAAAAAHPKILRAEAGANSLQLSTFTTQSSTRQMLPRVWLCFGLALAVVALARPQWGRLEEPVFDQSREILLAIDLSRSMLTPDVKPSRLERAKLLIQSLLEKLAGERVGLVVFSGTAFLQSPLSADYEILREFLPALGPDFLPEGGTNYGALIETSLQAFGTSGSADRFVVILSDGEATDEDWKSKMDELKKKSIRVIGLGVGTTAGAMIPDGTGQFVKDERGAVVLSKLESATLQELARATGGVYRDASTWVDLAALVNETIEAGRKGKFVEKNTIRLVERFQWPLALGLWCLLVSFCYEFPVRPRPRDIKLATHIDRPMPTPKSPTAAVLLVLLGLTLGLRPTAHALTKAGPTPAAAEPSALAKIVGRLAAHENRSASDWAELGRETVTWGSHLQSEQQPVPEGPVRDALGAVDLGAKLDAKATDWPKLREELEALLKKSDEDKQKQDQKDQQDKDDKDQDKDQKKQDQKQDQKKQDKSGQPKSSPEDEKDPSKSQDPNQKQDAQPPEQKPPGESAFGDMNKKEEPPPPPPQNTQKVGGAPEKKDEPKEPIDPALALPTQKLDQLRNQDSPAQLFQLMEGDRKPVKKNGKDW
ncbi:MAG: VWA domain-containing protein [Opitutus sp.]|nr:VWA domain-containing protein [Opitutus sp.]